MFTRLRTTHFAVLTAIGACLATVSSRAFDNENDIITLSPAVITGSSGVYTVPVIVIIPTGPNPGPLVFNFDPPTTTGGGLPGINQSDPGQLSNDARIIACQQSVAAIVAQQGANFASWNTQVHNYISTYSNTLVAYNNTQLNSIAMSIYNKIGGGTVMSGIMSDLGSALATSVNAAQGTFIDLAQQAQNTAYAADLLSLYNWSVGANGQCATNYTFTNY